MSDHDNLSIARDLIEAFNEADYERCGALLAPDPLYIETPTARRVEGRDAILEVFEGWRTAFPDARGTIVSAVTSDDTVALQLTWEGTQTGPLHGPAGVVPPSGQSTTTSAALFLVLEQGKIKVSTHYFDLMTMLPQLGAVGAAP